MTWRDDIVKILLELKQPAHLNYIYDQVKFIRPNLSSKFKARVRATLYENSRDSAYLEQKEKPNIFTKIDEGTWGISEELTTINLTTFYLDRRFDYIVNLMLKSEFKAAYHACTDEMQNDQIISPFLYFCRGFISSQGNYLDNAIDDFVTTLALMGLPHNFTDMETLQTYAYYSLVFNAHPSPIELIKNLNMLNHTESKSDAAMHLISDLNLDINIINALSKGGFNYVHQLKYIIDSDLQKVRNIGPTSIKKIREAIPYESINPISRASNNHADLKPSSSTKTNSNPSFSSTVDKLVIPESTHLSNMCLAGHSIRMLPVETLLHAIPSSYTHTLIESFSSNNIMTLGDLETFDYRHSLSSEDAKLTESAIESLNTFISSHFTSATLLDIETIFNTLYPNKKLSDRDMQIVIQRLTTDWSLQKTGDEWGITRERVRQIESKFSLNLKFHLHNNYKFSLLTFFAGQQLSQSIRNQDSESLVYADVASIMNVSTQVLLLWKEIFKTHRESILQQNWNSSLQHQILFDDESIFIYPKILHDISTEELNIAINSILTINSVMPADKFLQNLIAKLQLPLMGNNQSERDLITFLSQTDLIQLIPCSWFYRKNDGAWVKRIKTSTPKQLEIISALIYARDSLTNKTSISKGLYWDDIVNYINTEFENSKTDIHNTKGLVDRDQNLFYMTDQGRVTLNQCYLGERKQPIQGNKLIVSAIEILSSKGMSTTLPDIQAFLGEYVSGMTVRKYIEACQETKNINKIQEEYHLSETCNVTPELDYLSKIIVATKQQGITGRIIGVLEELNPGESLHQDEIYSAINKQIPGVKFTSIMFNLKSNIKYSLVKSGKTYSLDKNRIDKIKSDSHISLRETILYSVNTLAAPATDQEIFDLVDKARATPWGLFATTLRQMTNEGILELIGDYFTFTGINADG